MLVYYHGGGWVIGNIETHDVPCRALANRSGAIVASVDYRLAPEHRFPAAVEDAYAAAVWAAEKAADYGAFLLEGLPGTGDLGLEVRADALATTVRRAFEPAGEPALQTLRSAAGELIDMYEQWAAELAEALPGEDA